MSFHSWHRYAHHSLCFIQTKISVGHDALLATFRNHPQMNLPWLVTGHPKRCCLEICRMGVTMETCPCEVLLRSRPSQSPWRPWQRTEYSNLPSCLPWQLRQGHFGDSLGAISMESSWGCLWRLYQAQFRVRCHVQSQ